MAVETKTRVLGIDPGLNITGYGLIDFESRRPTLVEAGVVRGKSRGSLERRLVEIFEGIVDVIETFRPDVVAVEELYSHYKRPKTAILMGHARGVICLAAARAKIELRSHSATQIKKVLTGNGRAPKSQMQMAICQEFGLHEPPEPADVADALAIALCCAYLKDSPLTA